MTSLHYAIFTIQNYRAFDNFERRTEVQESDCLKNLVLTSHPVLIEVENTSSYTLAVVSNLDLGRVFPKSNQIKSKLRGEDTTLCSGLIT